MAQSYNPFDVLELRLNSIENLLLDIKHKYVSVPQQQTDQCVYSSEAAPLNVGKQHHYRCNKKADLQS